MASLAKVSTVDGQATDLTYGATPNDEATWDYDKVHGCFCDAGYEGYDCSLRACAVHGAGPSGRGPAPPMRGRQLTPRLGGPGSCASGDDARTPGENEVQALWCIGDGGSVKLEFGHVFGAGVVSSSISAAATANELKAALQARGPPLRREERGMRRLPTPAPPPRSSRCKGSAPCQCPW